MPADYTLRIRQFGGTSEQLAKEWRTARDELGHGGRYMSRGRIHTQVADLLDRAVSEHDEPRGMKVALLSMYFVLCRSTICILKR